jgi:hypothetical protein
VRTTSHEANGTPQAFTVSSLDEHCAVVAADTAESRDRDIV